MSGRVGVGDLGSETSEEAGARSSTRPVMGPRPGVTGVVLAGGRARRMGGRDKGLIELNGRPMVTYIIEGLRPQVDDLLINANRNLDEYAGLGAGVIPDTLGGYAGPLAGMASALGAARTPLVLVVPCDSPIVPPDLGERLYRSLVEARAELSVAHDGVRLQPVFALLRRELLDSLTGFLASGKRKIDEWYAQHEMALCDLADRPDLFLNINTPQDRLDLEERLRAEATG